MDKPGSEDDILINTSDPRLGLGIVLDLLLKKIWPLVKTIRKKLKSYSESSNYEHDVEKRLQDQLTICCSQLHKCVLNLFEIFKLECKQGVLLQESRNCTTERLSWCMKKLNSLDAILASNLEDRNTNIEEYDESFLATPMYFVNWIDNAFENLTKLSEIIYASDHNHSGELYDLWQTDMVSCVSELHLCLDELLLSAMTLCRYCLPSDQHIVKARCQVVLRETKTLLAELITGDLNGTYIVTKATLRLPIMPSNVNVLIDVLKDVLYALETNTNTALLGLLIDCFSNTQCPTERLKSHLNGVTKGVCSCSCLKEGGDVSESCEFVKDFDLHNERLMQIGTFAVSCSSDENRISVLRSGLASLEALDPHLVPALIISPESAHSGLLRSSWQHEVKDIRDSVFLIVDPAAFAEKCKQMMHQHLLRIVEQKCRDVDSICAVINIGSVVHEFFHVYNTQEPEALSHREELASKLDDLNKVQMEVKVVANLVFSEENPLFSIKMPKTKKEATMNQLVKRLKLLYTITSRINCVFHPNENEDQLFVNEICEEVQIKASNIAHTINPNFKTFAQSPRKTFNASRSAFARTVNRTSGNQFILKKLSHNWKPTELSFSLKIDALFDLTSNENGSVSMGLENKTLNKVRELGLHKFSPKGCKSSLRKAVLKRNYEIKPIPIESFSLGDDEFIDATTSLQITEILDQLNDMTNQLNKSKQSHKIHPLTLSVDNNPSCEPQNILTININKDISHVSKQIWNIPVNMSTVEISLNDTCIKDVSNASSQRSNVTTLERLKDLDLVENRLKGLKTMDNETAL